MMEQSDDMPAKKRKKTQGKYKAVNAKTHAPVSDLTSGIDREPCNESNTTSLSSEVRSRKVAEPLGVSKTQKNAKGKNWVDGGIEENPMLFCL